MKEYAIDDSAMNGALAEQVRKDFPNYGVVIDESLTIPSNYLNLIKRGQKKTTIKFGKGSLRLPKRELPAKIKIVEATFGTVWYNGVVVKAYSELDQGDARADGFATLDMLKAELERAYGPLAEDALLTIHRIEKIEIE